jgi:hypothetical protein
MGHHFTFKDFQEGCLCPFSQLFLQGIVLFEGLFIAVNPVNQFKNPFP